MTTDADAKADNNTPERPVPIDLKLQIARLTGQNEKLSYTLREAREHIASLRDEVDKLTRAPGSYGTVVGINDDLTVDVLTSGRKIRVTAHPSVDVEHLQLGAEVMLNDALNIVFDRESDTTGEVVSLKEVLEDGVRAIVVVRGDDERVCELATAIRGMHLRSGDLLRLDPSSNLLLEKLDQPEVEHLLLQEIPDISYSDIGGLDSQIEQIADAVELPFLHADLLNANACPELLLPIRIHARRLHVQQRLREPHLPKPLSGKQPRRLYCSPDQTRY